MLRSASCFSDVLPMTLYPHHNLKFNGLSHSFKSKMHFFQFNNGTFHQAGNTIQFLNQTESHFVLMTGLLSSTPAENQAPSWRREHLWLRWQRWMQGSDSLNLVATGFRGSPPHLWGESVRHLQLMN